MDEERAEAELETQLNFAVELYSKKTGLSLQKAYTQAMQVIVDGLKKSMYTSDDNAGASNILGKSDMSTSRSGGLTMLMDAMETTNKGVLGGPSKQLKTTNIDRLRTVRNDSLGTFNHLLIDLHDCSPQFTNVALEIEALRSHLLAASLAYRFAVQERKNAASNESLAGKVLETIENLAKDPSPEEIDALKFLNGSQPLKFVSNKMTYYDTKYCGTPDGVVTEAGRVTAVAEFKTVNMKSEGTTQLLVYLELFNLKEGYLVLTENSKHELVKITHDDKTKKELSVRYARYQKLVDELNKTK